MEPTKAHSVVPSPEPTLPAGTVLGRYRIDGRLSEGGMAILYHGRHVETGAAVAIKVMRSTVVHDRELQARFAREAAVMGRLSGVANVVAIYDVGTLSDKRRYLVMEFVRGTDLAAELQDLATGELEMEIKRACRIARDIAAGLRDTHARHIVHRDVKPGNIMLAHDPDGLDHAKIVDFGVSIDLDAAGREETLTLAGSAVGTSGYMAPEQAFGVAASPSFDIYAIGVLLFEMLTGRRPPSAKVPVEIPAISALRPDVPPSLERLVAQCLEFDAAKRPRSASEVVAKLDQLLRAMSREVKSLEHWANERPGAVAGSFTAATHSHPHPIAGAKPAAGDMGARPRIGIAKLWSRARRHRNGALLATLAVFAVSVAWVNWWRPLDAPRGNPGSEPAVANIARIPQPYPRLQPTPAPKTGDPTEAASGQQADAGTHGHEQNPTGELEAGQHRDESERPKRGRANVEITSRKRTRDHEHSARTRARPRHEDGDCRRARASAQRAKQARQWRGVLQHTAEIACWSQAQAPQRLRMQALLELRDYERCRVVGRLADDPIVRRIASMCAKLKDEA